MMKNNHRTLSVPCNCVDFADFSWKARQGWAGISKEFQSYRLDQNITLEKG